MNPVNKISSVEFFIGSAKATASYLAVLILRISAKALSLIGRKGHAFNLKQKARMIYVLHFKHQLYDILIPKEPVLARCRNIATRECIINQSDWSCAIDLGIELLKSGIDTSAYLKHNYKAPHKKGICEGATLSFIQGLLEKNISGEKDLQAVAELFRDGFSEKAAAMHIVRDNYKWTIKESLLNKYPTWRARFEKSMSEVDLHLLTEEIAASGAKELAEEIRQIEKYRQHVQQVSIGYLFKLASSEQYNLKNFDRDVEMQRQFDQLPYGCYALSDNCHVVAYVKYDFGNYILDPEEGLMRCPTSKELLSLFPKSQLTLTSYQKSSAVLQEHPAQSVA